MVTEFRQLNQQNSQKVKKEIFLHLFLFRRGKYQHAPSEFMFFLFYPATMFISYVKDNSRTKWLDKAAALGKLRDIKRIFATDFAQNDTASVCPHWIDPCSETTASLSLKYCRKWEILLPVADWASDGCWRRSFLLLHRKASKNSICIKIQNMSFVRF